MASGEKNKRLPKPRPDSGRATGRRDGSKRAAGADESREDFVVRGSVVETPEGYKLRF